MPPLPKAGSRVPFGRSRATTGSALGRASLPQGEQNGTVPTSTIRPCQSTAISPSENLIAGPQPFVPNPGTGLPFGSSSIAELGSPSQLVAPTTMSPSGSVVSPKPGGALTRPP